MLSSRRTCSSASSTRATAVSCWASSRRCFGSEPELAPMRIGIPRSLAALTTMATLSEPPMLPGLMRTAATPASMALSASEALKWMSAMTGSGLRYTILRSASASSVFGTATRTTSQPAEASRAICSIVASTSQVFVRVIDCTTTGAPPPIGTFPTRIWRSLAIRGQSNPASERVWSAASVPLDVVRETDDEEEQHEHDAHRGGVLVGLPRDGAAANRLRQRERDVPAVERKQRKHVQEGQRQGDERKNAEVVANPHVERLARGLDDSDRARHLVSPRPRHDPPQRLEDHLRHEPCPVRGQPDGLQRVVFLVRGLEREAESVDGFVQAGDLLLNRRGRERPPLALSQHGEANGPAAARPDALGVLLGSHGTPV